jgi:metallo-beta-lactamase family protein
MNVTFHGAVREVTGSLHLISSETDHILLDCGLFQGRRKETERKNRTLPFDPRMITNVVLSHAHIDHSGRVPLLTSEGFNGRVLCTRATADACEYLLMDSAKIQELDADYLNYKTARSLLYAVQSGSQAKKLSQSQIRNIKKQLKEGNHQVRTEVVEELIQRHRLEAVEPLYSSYQAEQSLEYFEDYPFNVSFPIGRESTCTFYEAGHILGSAFSLVKIRENGKLRTLFYSGDIGRFNKPIIRDPELDFPEEDREVDLMILESTYGNRAHEPVEELGPQLEKALLEAADRGGSVLIPAFAYGRTQELIYFLHQLYLEGRVPRIPVFVDSPLGRSITRVFGEHPELYDDRTHNSFLEKGRNPFVFEQVRFVASVDESMALMREKKPHIVIASSGMCEGGRILHHLRHKIHDERNTILIVGYMAENTLGRRILDEGTEYERNGRKGSPPDMRFLNKIYPLKAHVVALDGFSAHADQKELLQFLRKSNLKVRKIALVHGEEDQSLGLRKVLQSEGWPTVVPYAGQSLNVP